MVFTPLASPASLAHLDLERAGLLAFCALNTVVGYGAFAESLAHWEASRVGAVLALTPLGTLACAMALDAIAPSWATAPELSRGGWDRRTARGERLARSLVGRGATELATSLETPNPALGRLGADQPDAALLDHVEQRSNDLVLVVGQVGEHGDQSWASVVAGGASSQFAASIAAAVMVWIPRTGAWSAPRANCDRSGTECASSRKY